MDLKPGIYEHYKGGHYRLITVAKREGTLEDMAVYEPLYSNPVAKTFVRPLSEFMEVITRDGYHGHRFRYISESSE
jgi:hypothetical protein